MEVATRVPQASIRGNGVSFDQERLALEIKNLDFFYGNGFQGLKNVNLSIPEHKATAFIGPSATAVRQASPPRSPCQTAAPS